MSDPVMIFRLADQQSKEKEAAACWKSHPVADNFWRGVLLEAILEGGPRDKPSVNRREGQVHDEEGVNLGQGGAPARKA